MSPPPIPILPPWSISKETLVRIANQVFRPRLYFIEFHDKHYAVIAQHEDLAYFEVHQLLAWGYALSHPIGHAEVGYGKGNPVVEKIHQELRREQGKMDATPETHA